MGGACTRHGQPECGALQMGRDTGAKIAGTVLGAMIASSWPAAADEMSTHRSAALEFYQELRPDDSRAMAAAPTDLVLQLS